MINTALPRASLQIVSDELAVTLNDARVVLEQYAEGEGNPQSLERVGSLLHTARGVLRMTETHGASLLAEEMELTCAHLARLKRRDGGTEEPLEALMRAIVQLPAYVEGVLNGGRDIPLVLLPLLNDLRAARGRPLLSESTLLLLNVGSGSRARQTVPQRRPGGEDVCRLAHELRPRFQLALLGWIRGEEAPASLRQMYAVVERLENAATAEEIYQLWWVVAGVIEALLGGDLETSVSLKRLMGQVDREMKRLRTLGEAQFAKVPPTELINNLLYYVARARPAGPRVAAIRAAFNLSDLVPGDAQVEQARQSLSAPSVKLMQTVAQAIREDLGRVKDVLDIFVRTGMERVEELTPQLELLKKIGDTLGVLGLGELRETVQTRREELQDLISQGRRPEEAALVGIAAALLNVEDRLESDLIGMIAPRAEEPTIVAEEAPPERSAEFDQVTAAVMRECLVNLARVKDAVTQVTDRRGDGAALDIVPEQLQGIAAGLMMLGRERAASVVGNLQNAIRTQVREGGIPDRARLDRLADATVSLEYYLETLQAGRSDPTYMLDNAERCLQGILGAERPDAAERVLIADHEETVATYPEHVATEVATSAPPPPEKPKLVFSGGPEQLEPELLELFIEEARDEIDGIGRVFPAWERDYGNAAALASLRRSFHTLKGSGRMVGADVIGEFAWNVERLLNRLINGTIPPGPRVADLVARSIAALPALLEQLEVGATPKQDIDALVRELRDFVPEPTAVGESEPASPAVEAQAGETATAAAPDQPRPAMDPVLLNIFTREVGGHLAVLRRFVAESEGSAPPYAVPEELYRACHTLNGSVAMARVEIGLDLTEALNALVSVAYNRPARLPADAVKLLSDAATRVEGLLAWLAEPSRPVPGTADLVQRLQAEAQAIEHAQPPAETAETLGLPVAEPTVDEAAPPVPAEEPSIVVEELAMPETIELTGESVVQFQAPEEPTGGIEETLDMPAAGPLAEAAEPQAPAPGAEGAPWPEPAPTAFAPVSPEPEVAPTGLEPGPPPEAAPTAIQPVATEPEAAPGAFAPLAPEAEVAPTVLEAMAEPAPPVEALGMPEAEASPAEPAMAQEPELPPEPEPGPPVYTLGMPEAEASPAEPAMAQEPELPPEPPAAPADQPAQIAATRPPEPAAEPVPELPFDPEIAAIFAEEAAELLEAADAAVAHIADGHGNGQALADLQRYLHTLKGGARMAGLGTMGDFSHELETLLIRVGEGLIARDSALDELLQASLDELHRLREDVMTGELRPLTPQLAARVRAALRGDVAAPTAAPAEPVPPPAPAAPPSGAISGAAADEPAAQAAAVPPPGAEPPAVEAPADAVTAPEIEPVEVRKAAPLLGAPVPGPGLPASEPPDVAEGPPPPAPADAPAISLPALDRLSELARELEQPAPVGGPWPMPESPAAAITRPAALERRETARVDSVLLDQLLNNAGEISIFQSRLSQQVNLIQFNLEELGATVIRLREQLRKLELETEAQILFRHQEDPGSRTDFDPLELDRYSTIQQLSRSLAESAADVNSLKDLLQNMARDTEALLVQQARTATELQDGLMRTRMVPFQQHVPRLARLVRQTAMEVGKRAELHVQGGGELDRQVLERMLGPFEHMLRNAVVHGIELPAVREAAGKPAAGNIFINLRREGSEAVVEIADDGRGLDVAAIRRKAVELGFVGSDGAISDDEAMQFILRPGFSTADRLTQAAGRGIGMDVVTSEIAKLGGSLRISSVPGRGTTFTIRLPFTLAVTQALIVRVQNELYALPLPTVEGVIRISRAELMARFETPQPTIEYGGQSYQFRYLGEYLGLGPSRIPEEQARVSVVLVRAGEHSTALITDEMHDSREIVVKPVGAQLATIRGIAGATILGDGRIAVILDVGILVRSQRPSTAVRAPLAQAPQKGPLALVVDDSITMRRVTQRLLERNAFRVVTAKDGLEAIAVLQDNRPDIILLDIEMPRMDGYEFAKHVRNNPDTAAVPIVMITSRVSDKHRARAIEVGVNDYLGKPYQERQLLEAVRHQLKQA